MKPITEITKTRTYVIAEIGQNHNGDFELAKQLIQVAAAAGVDAVKGQLRSLRPGDLYDQEELDRPYAGPHSFGATYGEHRKAVDFTIDQHAQLRHFAKSLGVEYSVSVWDLTSAGQAYRAQMPWIKIPSAALVWGDLLETIAQCDVPVLLSTGGSTSGQIDDAIRRLWDAPWICLMQCCSAYPADFHELNMSVISEWMQDKDLVCDRIGFSGHHRGIAIDMAAVALGARVLERHFTLDRTMRGSDHAASLEPAGLMKLVRDVRAVEAALGEGQKRVYQSEHDVMQRLRTKKMVS